MKFTIDGREHHDYQLSNEQIVRLLDGTFLEMDDTHINSDEREFLMKNVYERFKSNLCAKSGETNDDVFARFFSNYVNRCPNDFERAAKAMGRDHRYLQNEMFKVFLNYVKVLAENCEIGAYDPRNKYAAETSKKIIDYFKEINYPY